MSTSTIIISILLVVILKLLYDDQKFKKIANNGLDFYETLVMWAYHEDKNTMKKRIVDYLMFLRRQPMYTHDEVIKALGHLWKIKAVKHKDEPFLDSIDFFQSMLTQLELEAVGDRMKKVNGMVVTSYDGRTELYKKFDLVLKKEDWELKP